jgi:hypothetical protein
MTASYTPGDAYESLPVPGNTKPTHTYGETFGDEFHAPVVRELLASMIGWHQRGVVCAGGQGILPTGTVLGQKTSDKKYYVYASGNSNGTQVPLGFLRKAVDTGLGALSADTFGNLVDAGKINTSVASGLDSNAITVLNGRTDAAVGVFYF